MASSITISVGGKTYTKNFTKTDAQVRQILRNFGASMEPQLPADATVQQEVDNIGDKVVRLISQQAATYDTQQKRQAAYEAAQNQAALDNQLNGA